MFTPKHVGSTGEIHPLPPNRRGRDQVGRYWSALDVSIIHLRRTELDMQADAAARDRFRRNGLQAAQRYDRKALALQMLSVLERVRAK